MRTLVILSLYCLVILDVYSKYLEKLNLNVLLLDLD